ncbi:hypothetical protein [Streptomyces sp. I05A-00742]|uniref:hypothetical protein n=1 Tax=Streptomyces sp. I05A-00742 TaxID=2732853 RepID=UPI0014899BCE|nr:hypothetical protein [Streptomyces sp. I05A-00742]
MQIRRGRRARSDDTVGVTPVVPDKEQNFRAWLAGDIPEHVHGYDRLVAGPGLLVATPDPAGRVARWPVPRTLAVERVRLPHRTDPQLPTGFKGMPADALVADCRDGEQRVTIVVDRQHMPWVLGALLPAAESEPSDAGAAEEDHAAGARDSLPE